MNRGMLTPKVCSLSALSTLKARPAALSGGCETFLQKPVVLPGRRGPISEQSPLSLQQEHEGICLPAQFFLCGIDGVNFDGEG